MRVLVTGASGFVGPYFIRALEAAVPDAEVIGCVRRSFSPNRPAREYSLDIADAGAVSSLIRNVRPTYIMHLAGISTLHDAEAKPDLAWTTNVFGTINIARALINEAPECVLVFAGSGEVYGSSANQGLALTEDALLRPVNEYAVTKASADLAIGALASSGLRSIRFRAFNHIGPGQTERYALASFAAQIARIEAGLQPPVITVGNLDAERDFLDVRDVATAYVRGVVRSHLLPPNGVYNLASGVPRRIHDLLAQLIKMSGSSIRIEQDPARVRPMELLRSFGDASKARETLDWVPQYDINATLSGLIEHWRKNVRAEKVTKR